MPSDKLCANRGERQRHEGIAGLHCFVENPLHGIVGVNHLKVHGGLAQHFPVNGRECKEETIGDAAAKGGKPRKECVHMSAPEEEVEAKGLLTVHRGRHERGSQVNETSANEFVGPFGNWHWLH